MARTLLDVAEVAPRDDLERAVETSERLHLFDLHAVNEVIARNPGRRGLRALGQTLEAYRPAPFTRSELERRFLALCRDADLPPPQANVLVAGYEVDAVWHDRKLIVELDSTYHATSAAFERDRLRDTTLQLAGYRVVRLTSRRLAHEPQAVVQTIQRLLSGG